MKKTARFLYAGIRIPVSNVDPSNGELINKDWDELQQEILDQLEDSRKFTKDQINEISELSTKDFLKCLRDDDEDDKCYNRARAIWEYKTELMSAVKNKTKTMNWAYGLDAMRAGASAEFFNY